MNDTMDLASHVLGSRRNSSSTLSQGIAVQLMVYATPSSRSCSAVMGRKGRNALATSTENTLPKLELAVVLMYLIVLP